MALYGPLRERVYKSSTIIHHVEGLQVWPAATCPVYKDWTRESMLAAMKAVIEDGMSIRQAAEKHHVPKSTLGDRVSGRVLPGATSGPALFNF